METHAMGWDDFKLWWALPHCLARASTIPAGDLGIFQNLLAFDIAEETMPAGFEVNSMK